MRKCDKPKQRQGGEIETRHALLIIAIMISVIAWWQLWPESFPLTKAKYQAQKDAAAAIEQARETRIQNGETTKLYKWRGDDGSWVYATKAPNDRDYETIQGTPNVTAIPSIEAQGESNMGEPAN
jgi:hypothetical protein